MPDRTDANADEETADTNSAALEERITTLLSERPLIMVSNRGPVQFTKEANGSFSSRQGSGGLVTAVSTVLQENEAIWIAATMGSGDRARWQRALDDGQAFIAPEESNTHFRLRFVAPDEESYNKYYNVISNPLLWFLQHYLWDTPRAPDITHETWDAWRNGYAKVNQLFAEEIVAACNNLEHDGEPIIMLQDYHLYMAPGMIRALRPNAIIQHFIHIPWPDPD